jgi:hypothetical protein
LKAKDKSRSEALQPKVERNSFITLSAFGGIIIIIISLYVQYETIDYTQQSRSFRQIERIEWAPHLPFAKEVLLEER